MKLSIVVPCYKEADNLEALHVALTSTLQSLGHNYEIILVNDGSPDDTISVIKRLAEQDGHIKYISFSRNFGKESAMLAGIEAVTGDCAVIMDADLQHPPELIAQMIETFQEGYDQVVMKRNRNGERLMRKLPTRIYYRLMNNVMDVRLSDGEGDFRLISREVVDAICRLGETNRFSKGIFEWVGFKKKVIPFDNVERNSGQSSFNTLKLFDYAIDGILNYNTKPLRVCFWLGITTMSVSLLYIIVMVIQIMTIGIKEPGYFTIIASILLLGSIQLISLSIIGEYIGRIYREVKHRPHYIVEESNHEEVR